MKRDMELLRDILLSVESQGSERGWYDLQIDGRAEEEISYHVQLAQDARLIEAIDLSTMDGICWRPKRLTFQGYEFLEVARNDTFWRTAKAVVLEKTGTLTADALKIALAEIVKNAMRGVL